MICDVLAWVATHRGGLPAQRSDDPEECRLAQVYKRLKTRRDKPYARGSSKPSDQKLTDQGVKLFDVIATAVQLESGLPGLLDCLLRGMDLVQTVDAFETLCSRLQALRVSGHVTPGGSANFDFDSMAPGTQAHSLQQNHRDGGKVAQQFGTYVWWIDLFVCGCARPEIVNECALKDYPHPESSPQCRVVWSGVLGAPTYVHNEGIDNVTGDPWHEDLFRFAVDAHIEMPECTEECPPQCVCEWRVICISPATLQVGMHADTRRAQWVEYDRCFTSPCGTEVMSMSVAVEPEGAAQQHVFRHLDIDMTKAMTRTK